MKPMRFDFQKQPGQVRTRFYAPDRKDALVSVVTPFYNAGAYFEQTFISMMNQTFPWFEWIIVNDGSPREEDVALLLRFAATDPRIAVITQENGGPSKARNTAVAHASTDLIVPLDADDLIDPTYLECLYWSLKFCPEAAWSFSNSCGFQEMEYIWHPPFDAKTMKTRNLLALTSMIRKEAFEQIGGLKIESVPYHEDWRLWLDLLSASKQPVHVASHLFWYRRLNTGRSSGVNGNKQLSQLSDQIIAQAASTVDESVQAIAFPLSDAGSFDYTPKFIPWTLKTDPTPKNKRILWLIPAMDESNAGILDHIAALKKAGYNSTVLATNTAPYPWRQKYEDQTDELFCLPEFLHPAHFPEFVSYCIQVRNIDLILLSDSQAGYYMLPWIRQHFPHIPIADCSKYEVFAESCGDLENAAKRLCLCGSPSVLDFAPLFSDDAVNQQTQLSLSLQQHAPLAAEFYAAGMAQHYRINLSLESENPRSLPGKVLRVLREEGIHGFISRTGAWLNRKKDAILHRLHL